MSGPRALIVIASQTQGLLLKLMLEEQGIEASCVETVEPAVAELSRRPFDLLMVEADGEAARTLTELRRRCPAPAMLLGSAERAAEAGVPADVHWTDPADTQGVVRQAMALLDRRNAPPTVSDILQRARILVVDDSATYREFLRAELEGGRLPRRRRAQRRRGGGGAGGRGAGLRDPRPRDAGHQRHPAVRAVRPFPPAPRPVLPDRHPDQPGGRRPPDRQPDRRRRRLRGQVAADGHPEDPPDGPAPPEIHGGGPPRPPLAPNAFRIEGV
ncbi:protein of unknown function (plasmid) [Azospirillum baldaniorum]|uniref:Response regulatory domain-containing protein n=1 Tax=Azospirillum baldaniorum TaxID=1064539 RepID=A0A9P1JVA5_9PROT|nr:protein of unknown function [Azospirillum baldaniorum]